MRDLNYGERISKEDVEFQRPCPKDAIIPSDIKKYIGKKLFKKILKRQLFKEVPFQKMIEFSIVIIN